MSRKLNSVKGSRRWGRTGKKMPSDYWRASYSKWREGRWASAESSDARMQPPPMKDGGTMTPEVESQP